MSLAPGETIEIPTGDRKGYWVVNGAWANGQTILQRVSDAANATTFRPTAGSLLAAGARKVASVVFFWHAWPLPTRYWLGLTVFALLWIVLGIRLFVRRRLLTVLAAACLLVSLGLGISAYTAYTALAHVSLVCGPIGSCAEVQASEYSKLFGIPMGVLGLNGYLLILVSWLIARQLSPKGGGWNWLPWGVALFGVLFSLRLTALEPFVIGATCVWCLGSAVSITIAFWLLSGFARSRR